MRFPEGCIMVESTSFETSYDLWLRFLVGFEISSYVVETGVKVEYASIIAIIERYRMISVEITVY